MQTDPIIKGILYGAVAQALTFFQFQGGFKYGWTDKHPWAVASAGIFISYLFMMSVKHFIEAFNGEIWPSRLIGFGIGVIVFTILSSAVFKEPLTLKTIICLFLGILIVLLQVFWK